MSEKRVLTIAIETDGAEDCPWIWDSHKDYILRKEKPQNNPDRHGVTVIGIAEGDVLRELRKAEIERDDALDLIEQLEAEIETLRELRESE